MDNYVAFIAYGMEFIGIGLVALFFIKNALGTKSNTIIDTIYKTFFEFEEVD